MIPSALDSLQQVWLALAHLASNAVHLRGLTTWVLNVLGRTARR
jgi:hypothetical protein